MDPITITALMLGILHWGANVADASTSKTDMKFAISHGYVLYFIKKAVAMKDENVCGMAGAKCNVTIGDEI